MRYLVRVLGSAAIVASCFSPTAGIAQEPDRPLTVAEQSNFTRTSLYADVMTFARTLQQLSPYVRLESMGVTTEGRTLPLLILGDPPPASPSALRTSGHVPIYIQANIHAGEVEGKEATLMFARDLVLQKRPPYLDRFVFLICPIFNADGNDKLGKNRRDKGPDLAGQRANGANLDLNRDGVKQETPEVRGLMTTILNRWDPLVYIDCHTTNGSYHQEPVTYSWPLNPNTDPALLKCIRDTMMPNVERILNKRYDTHAIPYGNFVDARNPSKGWEASEPQPRFLTNYVGLRNRFSILLENYSYADFQTRVRGNYHFLHAVMDFVGEELDHLLALARKADETTISLGRAAVDSVAVECTLKPLGRTVTIQGYEMDEYKDGQGRPRLRPSERTATYTVPLLYDYEPTVSVRRPFAYLIPLREPAIAANLRLHGLLVEQLTGPVTLDVETFLVRELTCDTNLFQGHYLTRVKGETTTEKKTFDAGTYWISTAQPLGNLAAVLLEPRSDDGLLVWNFFDRYLTRQWSRAPQPAPIYKIFTPANPAREALP